MMNYLSFLFFVVAVQPINAQLFGGQIKRSSAIISQLDCNGAIQSGNLIVGQVASGVSVSVTYTGGNGGFYPAQSIASTGVTGLTGNLPLGTLAIGAGSITLTMTGTPSAAGNANFLISLGGQSCTLTLLVYGVQPQYPPNTVHCNGIVTIVNDVTNPTTGKTWMDRNLGASTVAFTPGANYVGSIYQWGRRSDGHQCYNSPTTSTLSQLDQPTHGNFILAPNAPCDWRSPQNANLWQGVNGVNNPCPSGYRLPTETELNNERLSWTTANEAGAAASPLKLPGGGLFRNNIDGTSVSINYPGCYWSSTVFGSNSRYLIFDYSSSSINTACRAYGHAVRCIKN